MTELTTLSGAPVLPFSFGAMQFGGKADAGASAEMFAAARAAEITHFDTAWIYTDGRSEDILGALAAPERDALYIATKVGYSGGAGRENILAQTEQSLTRLGMDAVDLLYLHRFDPETDLRQTIDALATVQARGQARHLGLSNFAAWQVMKAQAIAAEFGTRIDVIQPMYSLVKRQAEVELLPMAADQGLAVCTYSPLGGGLLTGKYAAGGAGRLTEDDRYAARYDAATIREAAHGLSAVARDLGVHPATLAVAWVRAHETGPQPILSARSAEQLAPSLAALSYTMTAEVHARLCDLMPAPPPATDRTEEG